MSTESNRSLSGPLAYTLLTFGISWTLFGIWALVPDVDPLVGTGLLVGGGLGPFAAAVVLTARRRDRSLRDWLRARFRVRVRPWLYGLALAFPIVAIALAGLVHAGVLGGAVTPDVLPPLVEYPLFLGFIAVLGGGLEEPGWRGYLLPALQDRWRPLSAAVLVGVVWFAWHLPLFLVPATVQADIPLWLYAPQVVAISIVLTWLTNAASGAVLPAILLHAGANAAVNFYPVGGDVGATSVLGYGLLTTVVVLVAAVLVATGRLADSKGFTDPRGSPPAAEAAEA